MDSLTLEGGCLCRRTRFRVSGSGTNRGHCHCRSCRGASGAPFVAWATFPTSGFTLTQGELSRYASSAKVVRGFCGTCGTALTYAHQARPEEIDVTLAALDEPGRVPPEFHIWVSHKLPWIVLADGLPQYAEWRQET